LLYSSLVALYLLPDPQASIGNAGIPPLEESHEKRYGKDAAYKEYKASTSLLISWPKAEKPAVK
jgi:membrane-anchored protein YejM (alkaline phosphatase superfamily)